MKKWAFQIIKLLQRHYLKKNPLENKKMHETCKKTNVFFTITLLIETWRFLGEILSLTYWLTYRR